MLQNNSNKKYRFYFLKYEHSRLYLKYLLKGSFFRKRMKMSLILPLAKQKKVSITKIKDSCILSGRRKGIIRF
jgi:hypothetical protein